MAAGRYHIIIDLNNVPDQSLDDDQGLESFLSELPGLIDMKILKGPEIMRGIPENPGLTGFVIIDFSHISAHTFTNSKEVLVDIFSCKPYDQDTAIQATLNHFKVNRENAKIKEVYWE
jgi:S-adenosylmethionine decarboxylase